MLNIFSLDLIRIILPVIVQHLAKQVINIINLIRFPFFRKNFSSVHSLTRLIFSCLNAFFYQKSIFQNYHLIIYLNI